MIMLNDWHPDIIEFILSKMQNENVLLSIKKTFSDDKIIEEANRKLKFIPLTQEEKEMYELVLKEESLSSKPLYEKAKKILKKQGKYIVNNTQFLTGANISVAISDDFMKAVEKDDI